VISPAQRPLRDSTQLSLETDIRASGGFRTRIPSKGEAADLCLRPRDRWDQQIYRKYSKYIVRIHAVQSCATHRNECITFLFLKLIYLFIYLFIYLVIRVRTRVVTSFCLPVTNVILVQGCTKPGSVNFFDSGT
jgi:hypothetical protein